MAIPSTKRLPLAFGACSLTLALSLAGLSPAAAQEMYPGQNVTVNPAAINQVPCPNSPYSGGSLAPRAGRHTLPPVHLRPPKLHKRHRSAEAAAASASSEPASSEPASPEPTRAAIAEAPPAAKKPAPRVVHKATRPASPPPASGGNAAPAAIPFSFDSESAPVPPPPPKQAAKPEPTHVAKAAPLPKITPPKGLTKEQVVLFDTGSSALSENSKARLNDLAFSLKTALANGASQIELIAYAGAPGDTSSAARRLSLKRALAVREALIVDGVPAGRIDVRALGGVKESDNGATDRVDIFVKA